ncbi:MAG TPA: hypothetical protein VM325_18625 [Alphaproteobacteria bacterium]|nr:hypothetical protein [Alphaproteobacteria bacterium]
MTWFNRILIIIAAALILFAIGRFMLKSWIFAVAAAAVIAVVLAVYFGWVSRRSSVK